MALIQEDDLMVINRNDITYKITGKEVVDSFVPELLLKEVILSNYTPTARDTITVTLDVTGGLGPFTLEYQWYAKNTAEGIAPTLIENATANFFYVVDELATYEVACEVTITDSRSNSATNTSEYTAPAILFAETPVLDSVTLTQTTSGPERFTDQTFQVDTALSVDGEPRSTKTLEVFTDGAFTLAPESDTIVKYEVIPNDYLISVLNSDGVIVEGAALCFDNSNVFGAEQDKKPNNAGYIEFELPFPCTVSNHLMGEDHSFGNPIAGYERSSILNGGNRDKLGCYLFNPGANRIEMYAQDSEGLKYLSMLDTRKDGFGGFYNMSAPPQGGHRTPNKSLIAATHLRLKGITNQINRPSYAKVSQFYSSEHAMWQGGPPFSVGDYKADDEFACITFASDKGLDKLEVGDTVTEIGGTAVGSVYLVDGTKLWLQQKVTGTFQAGNTVVFPPKPIPDGRAYCVLDSDGNVTDISTTKPAETVYSLEENPTFEIKFPATFPGGVEPDTELGAGTRISASVRATNASGTSGPLIDSLVPGTVREYTEAEYRENRLRLLGTSLATSARSALIQSLLDEGFTQAEIDVIATL